jgi:hypothetical protein
MTLVDKYFNNSFMNIGFVYVIKFSDSSEKSFYKIVITSTTVRDRINQIQTSIPFKIKIVFEKKCSNYKSLEKTLHYKFKEFKILNEWFYFGENELDFISMLSQY